MIIFDGYAWAAEREAELRERVNQHVTNGGKRPFIQAILFREDTGSVLYTRLKREAAERVGIGYRVAEFSLHDPVDDVLAALRAANTDPTITGIIIQKPWKTTYAQGQPAHGLSFHEWWLALVSHIEPAKDVDGLTPATLRLIYEGGWQEAGRVVPATCMAVHLILHRANPLRQARRVTILGKSDLMGSPLQAVLYEQGYPDVELLGRAEIQARLAQPPAWKGRQVVISATGVPGLVRNADLDYDTIVIDVGEPRGDVEVASLTDDNVQFLSPVPGGVGPMTVQCLLENALELCTTKLIEPLTPIP